MHLVTPRLNIRPYEEGDQADFYEIFSDPVVMRDCEPPYDWETSAGWLQRFIRDPIAYAVALKDSGKMIGHALFKQLPGEEAGIYEIGWIYNRRFWRQGYAFEAARAQIAYGFEHLNLHKVCAETIDPVKSVPLMKKLGMKEEGVFRQHTRDLQGNWADLHWYAILRSDWQA